MSSAPIPKKEYEDLLSELLLVNLPDFEFDTLNDRSDDPLTTPEPQVVSSTPPNATKVTKHIQYDQNLLLDLKTPSNPRTPLHHKTSPDSQPTIGPDIPPNNHHRTVEIQSIEIIPPAPQIYSFVQPFPQFLPNCQFQSPSSSAPFPIIIVAHNSSILSSPDNDMRESLHHPTIRRQKQLFARLDNELPIDYVRR